MKIKKKLPGILGDIILLIAAVFCVLPFIYMLYDVAEKYGECLRFQHQPVGDYAGAVR